MTDNKKERTIQDILNDEIERQLEKNPPAKPSFEAFREMAYNRMKNEAEGGDASEEGDNIMPVDAKNIKRILRTAGVAAGFVMAVLAGMFAFNTLNSEVGADKNPKEEIVTEDGVIIEDGGYGSSDGEDNVWVITNWHDVESVKLTYPELLIPEYIPEGYEFRQLIVESLITNGILYDYSFYNKNKKKFEIEIFKHTSELSTLALENNAKYINSKKGVIYVQENEKKATMQLDDGNIITIWGELDESEIVKIVNGISD